MAHHAYVLEGDRSATRTRVLTYARDVLGLSGEEHPDVVLLEYGLFSVDDAREVARFASSSPVAGDQKLVVLSMSRLFHEAQNALLKLCEEPPVGTTIMLSVPSLGLLLPTLRSRLLVLETDTSTSVAAEFLAGDASAREKYLTKLIDRTKSDNDAEKQAARAAILELCEGILRSTYHARAEASGAQHAELTRLLSDLDAFIPILHERSAPLKLISEHLLLTIPASLGK